MQKKVEVKPAAKVADTKEVVKKSEVKEAAKAVETKEVVKKAEEKPVVKAAEKPAEVKTPAKAVETKEAVKEVAKEAAKPAPKKAAKKPAAKPAAKKAEEKVEEPETKMIVQFQTQEADLAKVEEKVKAQFVAEGHRASSIKKITIYVKPEDFSAYYVVNDKFSGRVDLF